MTPLDLDAIRARANAADTSWLPRWVPFDIRALLSEVTHLRAVTKAQAERAEQHAGEIVAQQRLTIEAKERLRTLEVEHVALKKESEERRQWQADNVAFLVEITAERNRLEREVAREGARERAAVAAALYADAEALETRGSMLPAHVALRQVADHIERGEHRREEQE